MCDAIRQRWSLDVLKNQRPDAIRLFQSVNATNVGVVQRGEDFGFTLKPRKAIRIIREGLGCPPSAPMRQIAGIE